MARLWPRLTLLAALVTLLAGCPPPPVVQLSSARILGATQYGVNVNMRLRVNNPNVFDVKVRNVRAQVTIAERFALPYIRFNPDQWMPANSWSYVDVPATIPWKTIAPLTAATLGSNIINYHVSGYVDVTATRMLAIAVNDHELDDDASISRADLVFAAMRGAVQTPLPVKTPAPQIQIKMLAP
jgi:LEA14-like dessication related protein